MAVRFMLLVMLVLVALPAAAEDKAVKAAEDLISKIREVGSKGDCSGLAFLVQGASLDVDTAKDGEPARLKSLGKDGFDKSCASDLLPILRSGVFQAPPFCSLAGDEVICTLMTPASIPRKLTFTVKQDQVRLKAIEWQRGGGEPGFEDDDDGDLPL